MGLDLPPFNGLRLFEAAARRGSFKRAAQELNLTSGAISHGVRSLEEWLGVELFDRSRGLALTPRRAPLPALCERGPIDYRERHKRDPCQAWRRVRRGRRCRRFYRTNGTPD